MARFLGTSSGRTTTTYVDTTVNTACSNLCTYVNTTCSTINGNINTACSNLCTYVNTCIGCACSQLCTYVNNCKVACNGSGAGLSNVVNSISVAGSGLSINQSTGGVTITGTAANDPKVLYKCAGCWNGSATIPVGDRGVYSQYEMIGLVGYWQYYCSQATFAFAGAPGCVANFPCYCCAHCTCGWVGDIKCFNGTGSYECSGAIAWPFGCDAGCLTACTIQGFQFRVLLTPDNPCDGSNRGFHYCFASSNNGDSNWCCIGVRNSGQGISCCGGFPTCLIGVCFTTPDATPPITCSSSIVILGHGKLL